MGPQSSSTRTYFRRFNFSDSIAIDESFVDLQKHKLIIFDDFILTISIVPIPILQVVTQYLKHFLANA